MKARSQVFEASVDSAAAWDVPATFEGDHATLHDPALVDGTDFDPAELDFAAAAGAEVADAADFAQLDGPSGELEAAMTDQLTTLQTLQQMQANQQAFNMMMQMNQSMHETSMSIIDNMGGGGPDYNHNGIIDWSE